MFGRIIVSFRFAYFDRSSADIAVEIACLFNMAFISLCLCCVVKTVLGSVLEYACDLHL